jgi:hypothetical protein
MKLPIHAPPVLRDALVSLARPVAGLRPQADRSSYCTQGACQPHWCDCTNSTGMHWCCPESEQCSQTTFQCNQGGWGAFAGTRKSHGTAVDQNNWPLFPFHFGIWDG